MLIANKDNFLSGKFTCEFRRATYRDLGEPSVVDGDNKFWVYKDGVYWKIENRRNRTLPEFSIASYNRTVHGKLGPYMGYAEWKDFKPKYRLAKSPKP